MKTDGGKKDIKDITEDNLHTFVFLYQIIQGICQLYIGLLYFITQRISKSKNDSQIIEAKNIHLINTTKTFKKPTKKINSYSIEKKDYKKILLILLMSFGIIIYNLSMAYAAGHQTLEKIIFSFFFIIVLSKIIFKKRIYRHQKLALIISVIGIIPIILAFALYLKVEEYNIFYDVFYFFSGFALALFLIGIKYLTYNKRINVFLLLFYQGILCFIYTIILFSIISVIIKGNLAYIYNIFSCDENNYICISHYYFNIIMYIILNTFLQLLVFLVVYHFSPELLIISDIFSPLLSFISHCIEFQAENGIKIFLTIFGYLIIAVASFIYNEIIVCNFCRLNENTWKSIDLKAHSDMLLDDTRDSFNYNEQYIFSSDEPSDTDSFKEMTQY